MLLRFRVSNHRSLRDEQELSLVAVPRKGEPKPTGPIPPTVRVAGIYGANASGKSNILHALDYFISAVRDSYAQWPVDGIPREKFLLDPATRDRPSTYEIDVTVADVRYIYGFEVDDERVRSEWLYSHHSSSRRRTLVRRELDDFYFGRSLQGSNGMIARLVRPNALYLSVAAANGHPVLAAIHREVMRLGPVLQLGQGHPHVPIYARLGLGMDVLRDAVEKWLKLADLGIIGFELERSKDGLGAEGDNLKPGDLVRDAQSSRLKLLHSRGPGNAPAALPLDAESAGTQIWLALLVQILGTLARGGAALIDEVDSSLHPVLSASVIQMFKDPRINSKDAQLIFTSHDVSLLGGLVEDGVLLRDEVWFTEKDSTGATSLFPLSDFHPRRGENFERAYLQGRYGAVPYVDISRLREIFAQRDAS